MPQTFKSLQEKLLLYRIRVRHDSGAFARIYDSYASRIYRFVYFKVPTKDEAEDLTSETFLKLWEYLRGGKPVRSLAALAYTIARNLVADYYRRRGAEPRAEMGDPEELLQLPDVAALAKIERSAELSRVLAGLKLLKGEYREVLLMRFVDGMSPKEIAPVLGKSSGAVRVLLHRAVETLRAVLTE